MMFRIFPATLLVFHLLLMAGCGRKYPEQQEDKSQAREGLLRANQAVVHEEAQAIEEFISRHGWTMEMTGTGLRYQLVEAGTGPATQGQRLLTLAYRVYLLDGTLCYAFDEAHPLKLITGRGEQIPGLEEGLMLMHEGGRARFVIPNHLAYGLTGDQDKIPPASALYYDVHLLKVETTQPQK